MILKREISLIKNPHLREAVKKCIKDRAKKLRILPASTSGKYHPPDERGPGGLIKHIKKVVWFIEGARKEFKLTDEQTDILLGAGVLHDIGMLEAIKFNKEGAIKVDRDKYRIHPKISAQIAAEYLTAEGISFTDPILIRILDLIRAHMSHWFPNCKQPFDLLEFILCMADYFTTQEEVSIRLDRE